jgi:hypothetical protein
LRILHGLARFSEDMDFSLLTPNRSFDFSPYCAFIQKELESWGFPVSVQLKEKSADSAIESAFLKAETLQQMLLVEAPEDVVGGLHRNQLLKIKVEVDTTPPPGFETESRYLLQPIPFAVKTYALPSLFAGKVHALLFRKWGRRVKGRDWFDLVWYAAKGVPVDLKHLSERMRQTGDWLSEEDLSEADLRGMLEKSASELDVQAAVSDVEPFVKRPDSIAVWSTGFFQHIARTVKGQQE